MRKLIILVFFLVLTIVSSASYDKIKIVQEKEDTLKVEPWMMSRSLFKQHKAHQRKMYKKYKKSCMRNYHYRGEFIKKED